MSPEEALVRIRTRWSRPAPDRFDVEERAAIRLEDDPDREVLVLELSSRVVGSHLRLFVRVHEEDRVRWGHGKTPRLIRGWHSGYVQELGDVDRILDGLTPRLEAAREAA